MDDFINNFVQYDGVSPKLPPKVSCFKCLCYPFFIDLPSSSLPIYTLNRVVVKVNPYLVDPSIQNFHPTNSTSNQDTITHPLSARLEITIYYTTCDLVHSVHSISHHFPILDILTYPSTLKPSKVLKPFWYVEDIFAHCPDTRHIYGHILLLAHLPI